MSPVAGLRYCLFVRARGMRCAGAGISIQGVPAMSDAHQIAELALPSSSIVVRLSVRLSRPNVCPSSIYLSISPLHSPACAVDSDAFAPRCAVCGLTRVPKESDDLIIFHQQCCTAFPSPALHVNSAPPPVPRESPRGENWHGHVTCPFSCTESWQAEADPKLRS